MIESILIGITITIIGIVWIEWNDDWKGFKQMSSAFHGKVKA